MPEKDELDPGVPCDRSSSLGWLDLLLDSAISTYADPGSDSGLEQRVLAAVSAAHPEQFAAAKLRRRWLPWAIAIPAAAGLLILWLSIGRVAHAPSTQPQLAHQTARMRMPHTADTSEPAHTKHPSRAKAGNDVAASAERLKPCPDTKLRCGVHSLPKLDVFPTPAPLTTEERALVTVADAGPPSQREALIESQQQTDAPLSIAALNVPPLAPAGDGKD